MQRNVIKYTNEQRCAIHDVIKSVDAFFAGHENEIATKDAAPPANSGMPECWPDGSMKPAATKPDNRTKCPSCGGTDDIWLSYPNDYRIAEYNCHSCGKKWTLDESIER